MDCFTFFFPILSLQSHEYFTFRAHLSLDKAHFRCSVARKSFEFLMSGIVINFQKLFLIFSSSIYHPVV